MIKPRHTIAIAKFKATCLSVLEEVRRTGQPVLVTRRGEPIAEIIPPRPPARPDGWLGDLQEHGRIEGDIVSPLVASSEWEVLGS
jgi:prevent-host-death family protein